MMNLSKWSDAIIVRKVRHIASTAIAKSAEDRVNRTWYRAIRSARKHGLPGTLAISLTSHTPRFPTLDLTLKSLLAQNLRADRIYLWIDPHEVDLLPQSVLDLQDVGVIIGRGLNIRSYNKIIPALEKADDFIVIADDDVYYPRDWLARLVNAHVPRSKTVVCARAHEIKVNTAGHPMSYRRWKHDISDSGKASSLIFPTGMGGVLYEPAIFHPDVTRKDLFTKLSPTNDDIWLYWMALLNGAHFRKVGPRKRPINWPKSQEVSLFASNALYGSANDAQISAIMNTYGFPYATPA